MQDHQVETQPSADGRLEWRADRRSHARVALQLADDRGHSAAAEMPMADALRLAEVLTSEMHGSCADTWLVERLAGQDRLWLTLSSPSRGFVRVTRVELTADEANALSLSLVEACETDDPQPQRQPTRSGVLRPLRVLVRWGVLHTRSPRRARRVGADAPTWSQRLHRSMLVLYRAIAAAERPLLARTGRASA